MITVHKYQFQIADSVVVEMPVGAKLLTIQTQDNIPTIWAMVETEQPMEKRTFRVYGTGHSLDFFATEGRYLATIHIDGFVWHIFE